MAACIFQEWLQQDFLPQMLFENFAVHPHRRGMVVASVTGSMNRIWSKWVRITFKTRCTDSTASNAFCFSCVAHSESFWPSHEKTCYPAAAHEEAAWSSCPERGCPQSPRQASLQLFKCFQPGHQTCGWRSCYSDQHLPVAMERTQARAFQVVPVNYRCCCSVAKSCLSLCDPMDCNTPDLPVPHCLPEFVHVHWIAAADVYWIQSIPDPLIT